MRLKSTKLKSVGVLSAMKVAGILYACMGLLLGGLFAFIGLLGGDDPEMPAFFFSFFAIIFFPIIYGVVGVIGGAIAALIYNAISGVVGGLEFELEASESSRAFD